MSAAQTPDEAQLRAEAAVEARKEAIELLLEAPDATVLTDGESPEHDRLVARAHALAALALAHEQARTAAALERIAAAVQQAVGYGLTVRQP